MEFMCARRFLCNECPTVHIYVLHYSFKPLMTHAFKLLKNYIYFNTFHIVYDI